jgi:hypothetical protein
MQLPGGVPEPVLLLLHRPPHAVHASPALGRPSVHVRGGRAESQSREPGGVDESHRRRRTEARPALVAAPVLQAARSGLAWNRPLPHRHRRLARRRDRLCRLRRGTVQSVCRHRPDLHGRRLRMQDVRPGRRLRAGLPDLWRMVLLPDERPHGLPDPLLGVQLPAGLRKPELPLLRAAADAVQSASALRRPAVHVPPVGRASS